MRKNTTLNVKLKTTLVVLLIAIILLWAVFYIAISNTIRSATMESVEQMSEQGMKILENTFLEVEHISFIIAQRETVKEFVKAPDVLTFYDRADEVDELVRTVVGQNEVADGLIIYKQDSNYYRFLGNMNNGVCDKAFYAIEMKGLPRSFYITVKKSGYIGYATGIYENDKQLGTVVILMNENNFVELLSTYRKNEIVEFALLIDGTTVAASKEAYKGNEYEDIVQGMTCVKSVFAGLTPFQIVVIGNEEHLNTVAKYFGVAVSTTALLFIIIVILYTMFWNKHFYQPTLKIMHEVEEMGRGERDMLSPSMEVSYAELVNQINIMYMRTENYNKAMMATLKKQINAHFTINVLTSIKRFAKKQEKEKTSELCDELSNLFRYACNEDEYINGLDEFSVIEDYIGIMKIRYPDRFEVVMDLDDSMIDYKIPRMLIQPIVENSITYGLSKQNSINQIQIIVSVEKPDIIVVIKDCGRGIKKSDLSVLQKKIQNTDADMQSMEATEHIALINIERRVKSYYGEGYGLAIESKEGVGTQVTLRMGCYSRQCGKTETLKTTKDMKENYFVKTQL